MVSVSSNELVLLNYEYVEFCKLDILSNTIEYCNATKYKILRSVF